jgi:hypothetical protein
MTQSVHDITLAQRFKPLLHLHPEDAYRPCNVEYYLANSALYYGDKRMSEVGEVDTENILSKTSSYPESSQLSFKPNADCWEGFSKSVNDAPYYSVVTDCEHYWSIQYYFVYAYNGAYSLYNIPGLDVGEHFGDMEHMTIHVDKQTQKVIDVYFAAHTDNDGLWVQKENMDMFGDRVIAYVAYHGHGLYPKPGVWYRYYGAANDYTEVGGPVWDPKQVVLIDEKTPWNRFKGHLGFPNYGRTPMYKGCWRQEDGISTGPWQRFLGCDKIFACV